MANIHVKRGSEGPRHDPYSYTEVTFYFTNKKRKPVIYHAGLGEWTKHGKNTYEENPAAMFQKLTGLNPRKAAIIPEKRFERYLRTLPKREQYNVLECIAIDNAMLANAY